MVVVLDNNVLSLMLHPAAAAPHDPGTGKPITRAKDRLDLLVQTLERDRARILIPAPVLCEFLTFATPDYLETIDKSSYFEVAAFDQLAAVEAAAALKTALGGAKGTKAGKKGGAKVTWQKAKIDHQIVAIAKVRHAERIYTTDEHVAKLAKVSGIPTVHTADLPIPTSKTPLLDVADEAKSTSEA